MSSATRATRKVIVAPDIVMSLDPPTLCKSPFLYTP